MKKSSVFLGEKLKSAERAPEILTQRENNSGAAAAQLGKEIKPNSLTAFEEQLLANNKVLVDQNETLLQLNKELDSFAHTAGHDLQNPLRKIQVLGNRILRKEAGRLSTNADDCLLGIVREASRMQALIQNLLEYARTAASQQKLEKADLNIIVNDCRRDFSEILEKTGGIIEAESLCDAIINPVQFRRVINNLVSNALKFMKPGVPPVIQVKSNTALGAALLKNNRDAAELMLVLQTTYCHITVSDNGIGFSPEYRNQIFEIFERLYSADEYPGSGIGLAIVKKIITQHDGFITATGEMNKGATFNIFLPHDVPNV